VAFSDGPQTVERRCGASCAVAKHTHTFSSVLVVGVVTRNPDVSARRTSPGHSQASARLSRPAHPDLGPG
jgi:hypothetical protein